MGIFARYEGSMNIPEEKRAIFREQMKKVLYYSGMMNIDKVRMNDRSYALRLLCPYICNEEASYANYNYFEDAFWEDAGFDDRDCSFFSGKIGSAEFNKAVQAAYTLYEMYDPNPGYATEDGDISDSHIISWLNHILDENFSVKERLALWKKAETYMAWEIEHNDCDDFQLHPGKDMIPYGYEEAVSGTELADLCYIRYGTSSIEPSENPGGLNEITAEGDTYPAKVYQCKRAVKRFLDASGEKNRIIELLKKTYDERKVIAESEDQLCELAGMTLYLPARVPVYLMCEALDERFWREWIKIRKDVYSDEEQRSYASEELIEERKELASIPLVRIRTSEYLRYRSPFYFEFDRPDEICELPEPIVSDDDRAYWWDGSDEVIFSEEMENWLKELAERHKQIMGQEQSFEKNGGFTHRFIDLFKDLETNYEKIYPFQEMFYEFIEHAQDDRYLAAVELLREIGDSEENRKIGSVIEYASGDWSIEPRKVTHNQARMKIKRYLAVMANRKLRKEYFGF